MVIVGLAPLRGGRYRATVGEELLVASSRDPEHEAVRALLARGISGTFATRWAGSCHVATKPRDIAAAAAWSVEEGQRLRIVRHVPFARRVSAEKGRYATAR